MGRLACQRIVVENEVDRCEQAEYGDDHLDIDTSIVSDSLWMDEQSAGADASKRCDDTVIERHLAEERQMVFLSGPRQVGKTTLCEAFQTVSMNWDSNEGREIILRGARAVAEAAGVPMVGAVSLVGVGAP